MPYIDFEKVEQLADIERLAEMLNLPVKRSGTAQLRCPCPVHGGERSLAISPQVRSRRGSLGCFFCQEAKEGGDRIALVAHCMEIGQQDAAFFIAEQFGTDSASAEEVATVPQKEKAGDNRPVKPERSFDPAEFAAKLTTPEGMSEQDAKTFRVGIHRGALYVPAMYSSGSIAGFWKVQDGKLIAPKEWLPDSTNIVQLRRA